MPLISSGGKEREMWRVKVIILLSATVLCGCIYLLAPDERFLKLHYVVSSEQTEGLTGPYKVSKVASPTSIIVRDKNGDDVRISMRGCLSTGTEDADFMAGKILGTMRRDEVYLLARASLEMSKDFVKGIVYHPANRVHVGRHENGSLKYEVVDYTIPQLLLIHSGYCTVDRTDTNYPLYEVFLDAERLARRHRKGYWEKHREPPMPPEATDKNKDTK